MEQKSNLDRLSAPKGDWEKFFLGSLVHQTPRESVLAYTICHALEKDRGHPTSFCERHAEFPFGQSVQSKEDAKKYEACAFSYGEKDQAETKDWEYLCEMFPQPAKNINFSRFFIGPQHKNLMTLCAAMGQSEATCKVLTFFYMLQRGQLRPYFSKIIEKLPADLMPEFFARMFSDEEHLAEYRAALSEHSPLVTFGFLTYSGRIPEIGSRLLDLLGNEILDQDTIVSKIIGKPGNTALTISDFLHFGDEVQTIIRILRSALEKGTKGVNILLYGDVGSGKTELAKAIGQVLERRIYFVAEEDEFNSGHSHSRHRNKASASEKTIENELADSTPSMAEDSTQRMGELLRVHALLEGSGSLVCFDEIEDLLDPTKKDTRNKLMMNRLLENNAVPTIWCGNDLEKFHPAVRQRMTYSLNVGFQPTKVRQAIWITQLRLNHVDAPSQEILQLARTFNIPARIITKAAATWASTGNMADAQSAIIQSARLTYSTERAIETPYQVMAGFNPSLLNIHEKPGLVEKFTQAARNREPAALYIKTEGGMGERDLVHYIGEEGYLHVIELTGDDLIRSKMMGTPEDTLRSTFSSAISGHTLLVFRDLEPVLHPSPFAKLFLDLVRRHTLPFVVLDDTNKGYPPMIQNLCPSDYHMILEPLKGEGFKEMFELVFGNEPTPELVGANPFSLEDLLSARRMAELSDAKAEEIPALLLQQKNYRIGTRNTGIGFHGPTAQA